MYDLGVVVVGRGKVLGHATELVVHLLAHVVRPHAGAVVEELLARGNVHQLHMKIGDEISGEPRGNAVHTNRSASPAAEQHKMRTPVLPTIGVQSVSADLPKVLDCCVLLKGNLSTTRASQQW